MGDPLRIALLQILPPAGDRPGADGGLDASLAKGLDACRQARELGADIAVFPEMWSCGYASETRHGERRFTGPAIAPGHPFLLAFQQEARRLEMAIAITYLEACGGAERNTATLFDRRGNIVLTYAKVHTCAFDQPEKFLTAGTGFPLASVDTAAGQMNVGCMICFDREFPESARTLAHKGAELILTPNSCELEYNRLAQLHGRAFENMLSIAVANYPAPKCNGNSILLDGMAFDREGQSRRMDVVHAGPEEGIYLGELDLDALRRYRSEEPWGVGGLRPEAYSA